MAASIECHTLLQNCLSAEGKPKAGASPAKCQLRVPGKLHNKHASPALKLRLSGSSALKTLSGKRRLVMKAADAAAPEPIPEPAPASVPVPVVEETSEPSELAKTIQLGSLFGLWYLFNIYFNIYNKQVRALRPERSRRIAQPTAIRHAKTVTVIFHRQPPGYSDRYHCSSHSPEVIASCESFQCSGLVSFIVSPMFNFPRHIYRCSKSSHTQSPSL